MPTIKLHEIEHFVNRNAGSSNQNLYVYDASGTRALPRITNGSGITMHVHAFRLEQHTYTANSSHTSDLYYYSLGNKLLEYLDKSSNTTCFYLTDTLGSVLVSFSNIKHSVGIAGNQVFGRYGNFRDAQGTFKTPKGFTDRGNDSLTHLDFYRPKFSSSRKMAKLNLKRHPKKGTDYNHYSAELHVAIKQEVEKISLSGNRPWSRLQNLYRLLF